MRQKARLLLSAQERQWLIPGAKLDDHGSLVLCEWMVERVVEAAAVAVTVESWLDS